MQLIDYDRALKLALSHWYAHTIPFARTEYSEYLSHVYLASANLDMDIIALHPLLGSYDPRVAEVAEAGIRYSLCYLNVL